MALCPMPITGAGQLDFVLKKSEDIRILHLYKVDNQQKSVSHQRGDAYVYVIFGQTNSICSAVRLFSPKNMAAESRNFSVDSVVK